MIAVVGDIHGCLHTLTNLIAQIKQKYPSIEIYSVGDLVDRGNFSYEVVEFVKSENIQFVPGNHDYMMYYFIKNPSHEIGRPWPYNGYETTLISYNERFDKLNEHLDLIVSQPLYYNLDDCFISHAGISKSMKSELPENFLENSKSLDEVIKSNLNSEDGILWARGTLLNIGKLQIVGHSIKRDVVISEKSNAIYIDTGVYLSNRLSAVIIEDGQLVEVLQEKTHNIDLKPNF
jgi:serine/threonine protein phosphatase 1